MIIGDQAITLEAATGDPVQVARDGVAEANTKYHDVVIIDTAGRLGVDAELMQQAADIRAAVDPDEVLFVIDAMIGQAAVETAQAFQEGVDFTGRDPGYRYLRAKGNSIEGGTSEIMRNVVAERVLGLPPEHRPDKGIPFKDVPR